MSAAYELLRHTPASVEDAIADYLYVLDTVPGYPYTHEYDVAKVRIAEALLQERALPLSPTKIWPHEPGPPSPPSVPRAVRALVYERDGHRCRACGSTENLTIDHVTPRKHGGGNEEANLQTLCGPCNSRKGARVG